MYNDEEEKKLIIWLNGKKVDTTFVIYINQNVNTMKRLKDVIISTLDYPRQYIDRILIYNYKGLEIDEIDLPYLNNDQILYVSLDGLNFNVLNYVYEFEFVKWIKSGGYGKVFLAKHVLKKDFHVAIKKIDISNLSTDEIYNISREAMYLQSFQHKNIIKYINSYIYENHFYTIMDMAYGGELVTYLTEKNVLSEMECKRIFKQIHDAVKYIHSRNVIHRDLKPNNILFLDVNRENVVLIDFGISGYNSGNIKESIKAWTTKFIPPELAAGLSYSSSPKFDVWALGVILFQMLFGQYPFDATKDSEIITKIMRENHKYPSNITISKSGYKLIDGLLEKNQQLRIGITDVLFDEWYDDSCSSRALIKERLITDTNKDQDREKFKDRERDNYNFFQKKDSSEIDTSLVFSQIGNDKIFTPINNKYKFSTPDSKTPNLNRLKHSSTNSKDLKVIYSTKSNGIVKHTPSFSSNLSKVYSFSVNMKKINSFGSLNNLSNISSIGNLATPSYRNSPTLSSSLQMNSYGRYPTLSKSDGKIRSLVNKIQSTNK